MDEHKRFHGCWQAGKAKARRSPRELHCCGQGRASDMDRSMRICACVGSCKGREGLAKGWQCALEPFADNLQDGQFHPDNPVFARTTFERMQQAHKEQRELVEWAMTLLCSATPNHKLLSEQHQQEWCQGFGKWFAEANTGIPSIKLDPNGVYAHLCEWLMDRQGRSIHRVDSNYRAIDAQTNWYADADTLPLLSDAVLNCPKP